MKRLALVAVLAISAAGCTPEQEAQWSATIQAFQNGVRVSETALRQTLDGVCAQQAFIIPTAQTAIAIAQARGSGPRTTAAVRNINAGIAGYVAACQGGTANVSLAQLATRAWNAYNAIRAANAQATAANGA